MGKEPLRQLYRQGSFQYIPHLPLDKEVEKWYNATMEHIPLRRNCGSRKL
jgi:hypothetical protein